MASEASTVPPAGIPDFMSDPDAVLKDVEAQWRYGRPPDYTKTRKYFVETKKFSHEPGSLANQIENLIKNWEIEASFKTRLLDWRTVDLDAPYTFAINGLEPCGAEHMLRVGTYNAIITPNGYYDPATSDFASSHKTFKRMMPTFAFEVVEVYSGPPVVSFKWRHWGQMRNDYVGFNGAGEKVTIKAHGGDIDIEGVTVAHLNSSSQVTKLKTWFDSNLLFRQMDPHGNAATYEPGRAASSGSDDETGPAMVNGQLVDHEAAAGACPFSGATSSGSGSRGRGGSGASSGSGGGGCPMATIPEMNAE